MSRTSALRRALFVLTGLAAASTATVVALPAAVASTTVVSGTVTDSFGNPVAFASVQSFRVYGPTDVSAWYGTTTDAAGHYTVDVGQTGTYRICVSGVGDVESRCYDDAVDSRTATDIAVGVGGASGIDQVLQPATHLRGTVTGPGGSVAAGVRVTAYRDYGDYFGDVATTTTGADGTYDLARLPAGTYRLGFDDEAGGDYLEEFYDDAARVQDADDLLLARSQTLTSLDARLAPAASITGRVTLAGSTYLYGSNVTLYCPHGDGWWECGGDSTDDDGRYTFDGLAPGAYRLGFASYGGTYVPEFWDDRATLAAATDIVLTAGQVRTGVSAQLVQRAHITGTVVDGAGDGVAGAWVTRYFRQGGAWVQDGMNVYTDSRGRYDFSGVAPGVYRVCFEPQSAGLREECWRDARTIDAGTDITVKGSNVTKIDAVLPYEAVVRNTTKPAISGTPRVGRTLKVSAGRWSPSGVSLTYQWLADGTVVRAATSRSLRVTGALVGKRLSVLVVASAPQREPAVVRTKATGKVRR